MLNFLKCSNKNKNKNKSELLSKIFSINRVRKNGNDINLWPLDDCVIVEVKKIKEKTEGGIYLNEHTIERDQMSIDEGILFAAGDLAFYDLIANGADYPKVGNKVFFKMYSGMLHSDKEKNREFRIIRDQDIYCYERDL